MSEDMDGDAEDIQCSSCGAEPLTFDGRDCVERVSWECPECGWHQTTVVNGFEDPRVTGGASS
jgi:predicted RNA-binding Zn-ribbon protein involved in translation (DUF1610 family)